MNLFNIISIMGMAIALFTIVLIGVKRKKWPLDYLLIAWLSALGINLVYFLVGTTDKFTGYFIMNLCGLSMPLLHAPIVYLFVKYAFSKHLHYKMLLHFLPFLAFLCWIIISRIIMGADSMSFSYGFLVFMEDPGFPLNQYGLYLALVSGVYTVLAYQMISKQKIRLEQSHSNELRNLFDWLQKWILAAIIFFLITYLTIEIAVSTDHIMIPNTFRIVSVFMSIYIFYVSFFGIKKTSAFHQVDPEALNAVKVINNVPEDREIQDILEQLNEIIDKKQLYLQPDLTITQLSQITGIPTGKISSAINRGTRKNFYDFINEYRVKLFISRLSSKDSNHLSLLGLAYDCGFGSKSTFNSFFKRYTGQTPSQYKKNLEKKSV